MADDPLQGNAAAEATSPGARLLVLVSVLLGTSIVVLDSGIVNVALPTLVNVFGVTPGEGVWVVVGQQLATACFIIPTASIGLRFGVRNFYVAGIATFALGALACVLAPSFGFLVAARVVQGLGAAIIVTLGITLVRQAYPDRMLGPLLGWYAMVIAVGSATAPVLGGIVLANLGWKWIFAFAIVPGLISASLILPSLPDRRTVNRKLDLPGFIAAAVAMASFIAAVDSLPTRPGLSLPAAGLFLLSGWLFIRRQRSAPLPALPLDVFGNRLFSFAAATSFLSFTSSTLAMVAFVFLMEFGQGRDPLATALLLAPWPIATAIAAPLAGYLTTRVEGFRLVTTGMLGLCIGFGLLATLSLSAAPADIVWRAAFCGFAFGFFQAPNNREMMGQPTREQSGAAAAVLAATRTMAMSLGAALAGLLLADAKMNPAQPSTALAAAAAIALVGAGVSAWRARFHVAAGA